MNQDHNWQDLSPESKVVASGRPAKKADGETISNKAGA